MSKLTSLVLLLILVAVVGVGVFLATWDIPPPSAPVQKEISNDRLRP
jgi:hypothetical protein